MSNSNADHLFYRNPPAPSSTETTKTVEIAGSESDKGFCQWQILVGDFGDDYTSDPFKIPADPDFGLSVDIKRRPQSLDTLHSSVSVNTSTGVDLLSLNPDRQSATIVNNSDKILYLMCGSHSLSTSSWSYYLNAGEGIEIESPRAGVEWKGLWTSGATGNAQVTEWFL